jgi:hypothetical protein
MKSMRSLIILSVLILFSYSMSIAGDTPLNLELNLEPGTSYKLTMEINQVSTMIIDSRKQVTDQKIIMEYDYDIKERNADGNMRISARYSRIKINSNMGPQRIDYDSDNPPDYYEPSTIGFKAIIGSEVELKINADGEILEISGIDEIIDNILAEANLPETKYKARFEDDIRNQFGYDATKDAFEQITGFFPEESVAVGDKWNNRESILKGFPMIIDSEYELLSREDNAAVINVNSLISSPDDTEPIQMGPISLKYDFKGSQSGKITVDEITGLPMIRELTQEFSGTVTMSGGEDEPTKTWPISSEGNVLIKFERR